VLLASLSHIVDTLGYTGLFLIVAGESAGLWLPGETALIVAAVLASRGRLSLPIVIATAASAAIIGDNVGYWIGRRGGRWLLTRPGRWQGARLEFARRGEEFFERHGPKAVFFARWLPVLRITAAWLAGVHRLEWRRFLLWNALGGIGWATSVAVVAYLLGAAAERAFRVFGIAGVAVVVLVAIGLYVAYRRRA